MRTSTEKNVKLKDFLIEIKKRTKTPTKSAIVFKGIQSRSLLTDFKLSKGLGLTVLVHAGVLNVIGEYKFKGKKMVVVWSGSEINDELIDNINKSEKLSKRHPEIINTEILQRVNNKQNETNNNDDVNNESHETNICDMNYKPRQKTINNIMFILEILYNNTKDKEALYTNAFEYTTKSGGNAVKISALDGVNTQLKTIIKNQDFIKLNGRTCTWVGDAPTKEMAIKLACECNTIKVNSAKKKNEKTNNDIIVEEQIPMNSVILNKEELDSNDDIIVEIKKTVSNLTTLLLKLLDEYSKQNLELKKIKQKI